MSTPARLSMYLDPLSPHYLKNENIENSGSYISAHNLLKLLNELRKRPKCEIYRAFYLFFATSLINSIIQEHKY